MSVNLGQQLIRDKTIQVRDGHQGKADRICMSRRSVIVPPCADGPEAGVRWYGVRPNELPDLRHHARSPSSPVRCARPPDGKRDARLLETDLR